MADFDPVSYMMGQKVGGGGGGGSSTLSGLTDVDISNPSNGQTLVYNSTSGKWENGAGGGGVLVVQVSNDHVCDKTTREMLAAMEAGGVSIKTENQPGYYDLDVVNGASVLDNAGTKTYEFYTAARTYASTSLDDYPSRT